MAHRCVRRSFVLKVSSVSYGVSGLKLGLGIKNVRRTILQTRVTGVRLSLCHCECESLLERVRLSLCHCESLSGEYDRLNVCYVCYVNIDLW